MRMFQAAVVDSDADSASSGSWDAVAARRARCLARLAGTRVEVFVRDGSVVRGILSVQGNEALYPADWGELPLPAEEVGRAMRYVRGANTNTVEGWRTVVARRTRRREEGKFERLGKFEGQMLWLKQAQRRPSANSPSSPVYDLLGITWRDVHGLSGTLVDDTKRATKFKIDTQITQAAGATPAAGRVLEKWADGGPAAGAANWPDALDGPGALDEVVPWNQFEENDRMFGVKTTYDEGLYTTQLNIKEIPDEVQKRAAELAAEMNGGRYKDEDADEEDEEKLFSAVAGTGSYTSYQQRGGAPHRRSIVEKEPPRAYPNSGVETLRSNDAAAKAARIPTPAAKNHRRDVTATKELLTRPNKNAVIRALDRTKLPKDNINALNLEPIKKTTAHRLPGAVGRINASADKIPANRQRTLEEFSQCAQVIQKKMEKRGWTSPSTEAPKASASSAAEQPPTAAASPPPPPQKREDCFQFNPNANSFTPKGDSAVPPPPPLAAAPATAAAAPEPINVILGAIDSALVHSASSSFGPPLWAPRYHMSYSDCLAAPHTAFPYTYEVAYAPMDPMAVKDESPAGTAIYSAMYPAAPYPPPYLYCVRDDWVPYAAARSGAAYSALAPPPRSAATPGATAPAL